MKLTKLLQAFTFFRRCFYDAGKDEDLYWSSIPVEFLEGGMKKVKKVKIGNKIQQIEPTFPITFNEDVRGSSSLKTSQIKQPSPHMSADLYKEIVQNSSMTKQVNEIQV